MAANEAVKTSYHLDQWTREEICYLHGQGLSNRQIADHTGFSHTTINKFIKERFGPQDADLIEPANIHLLNVQLFVVFLVLIMSLKDRFISARKVAKLISEKGLRCCKSTVAEVRKKLGLLCRWTKKTEKLTEEHVARRAFFATCIQADPAFNLPWVISDECSFVLSPGRKKLYRFRGENSHCIFQEFAGYPIKAMAWGAIGPNYRSPLMWFTEHVKSQTYCEVLSRAIPGMRQEYGDQFIFQQDGASSHTAHDTKTFLTANNVPLLPDEIPWPASSPDLSPIEHIWAYIKNRINTEHLHSRDDLIREVNAIWYSDATMELINTLMATLKPRIWTLEDLQGASLSGHQDMIRVYRVAESGQVSFDPARQHARTFINSHSVPSKWIETT
jgi:hypothetical protein